MQCLLLGLYKLDQLQLPKLSLDYLYFQLLLYFVSIFCNIICLQTWRVSLNDKNSLYKSELLSKIAASIVPALFQCWPCVLFVGGVLLKILKGMGCNCKQMGFFVIKSWLLNKLGKKVNYRHETPTCLNLPKKPNCYCLIPG